MRSESVGGGVGVLAGSQKAKTTSTKNRMTKGISQLTMMVARMCWNITQNGAKGEVTGTHGSEVGGKVELGDQKATGTVVLVARHGTGTVEFVKFVARVVTGTVEFVKFIARVVTGNAVDSGTVCSSGEKKEKIAQTIQASSPPSWNGPGRVGCGMMATREMCSTLC